MNEDDKEKAERELKKFKKEFDELMAKYPNILVGSDMHGDLRAKHAKEFNTKIYLR
jgi:hypothetical protein